MMKELHPEYAWDQDAELDCVDDKEVAEIVSDGDDDACKLIEDMEADSEWFDGGGDDEFMDDDPITEEEAMDWARRFGGEW